MDESQPENMEVDSSEENNITSKSASSGDSNKKGSKNTNNESNNLDMETDAVNNTSDVENSEQSSQSVKTSESEKEISHEINDGNCHSSQEKSKEDFNDKEGSKNGHSNSPSADSSGSPVQREESSPNRTDDHENGREKSDVTIDDEMPVDCEDSQPSGTKENSSGDKVEPDKTGSDLTEEEGEASTSDKNDEAASNDGVEKIEKEGASDIEEIPVYKKPAELIDLEDDDGKNSKKVSAEKEGVEDESTTEDGTKDTAADDNMQDTNTEDNSKDTAAEDSSKDSTGESNAKGLKLRSLASLVDTSGNDSAEIGKSDANPLKSGSLVPNPEAFGAIGEIVEHKDMFFDPDAGGLPLRISNVVGGEDCITGLAMDDDRDMFSSIQIASVTTLIDPISPEDPNKENEDADMEKSENANLESSEESGIKIVSAESLASKEGHNEKVNDSSGPKLRISSAVSEMAKDTGVKESSAQAIVYHILRSILTMPRVCIQCGKKVKCDFRITKKAEHGTFSFICSSDCRNNFVNNLKPTECVEKPRLIFEKLCGMCHKDLTTQPRSGQFSWETREFCSEDCLTSHLEEVASTCHMCNQAVRPVYIGKYCVRFGSDIHQFCSNHCLERYKTKIKVCCYCQKNVENVNKVTSPANKEYCSIKCLKRAQRRDIGQQNYSETRSCTVCQAQGSNRYEFLLNGESQQLCSDPCLNVFKYVNKVKAVTCCLCFRVMNAEDVSQYLYHGGHQLRVFCSDSCVNVFILSARKIVICDTCKVKKYNFDMIHRQVDEDFREFYYCSLHCLKTRDMGATSADKTANSGTSSSSSAVASGNISSSTEAPIAVCSMCNTVAKAQFHMVMSDSTLRSFCRYNCASRYKSTFGFLVEAAQPKDASSQGKNAAVSTLRPKPTSQLTSDSTSPSTNSSSKPTTPALSQETLQATTELLKMLVPPTVVNKTTMCKPSTCTKGVYCKPHPWHRHTQTDLAGIDSNMSDKDYPPILPVPIPCYVPAPMCMYNVPCPVPIFVPIPLPVPVFLPTSAKTSKDVVALMKKIQDEIPTDPIQAEMLLLARQTIEQEQQEKEETRSEDAAEQAEEPASPVDNFTTYSGDDEAGNDETGNDELNSADEACLNTMEEDLPRYPLRDTEITSNYSETETLNENKGKRKKRGRGRPRKRLRRDSDESQSPSDAEDVDDPDFFPEPETVLEEEFQGPFLNKMYGLTAWKSWVTKKNAELAGVSSSRSMKLISEDLLTMNCDELNYALCLFLKDLRKPNGEAYQPDTILYLLLGIQQHLFESARTDCIFMDFGFEKFTNSLDEITRTFWVAPTLPGVSPMITLGVTRITEAMLWECRQLGAHTPQVLLNTLFYFNTKVFRLRTVEEHLAMSFVQIVKQWRRSSMGRDGSGTRTTLLKYYPKKSSADGDKPKPNYEMHENRDDPLRCPVKLYEFYLSKCPESVRNQRNIYYVYPERSCVPDSPVWFSTQAVHASSIAKMLHRALMVREVQEAFVE